MNGRLQSWCLMSKAAAKYLCLVRWCRSLGSYDYYIQQQLEQAVKDDAPTTAIYERDGVWHVAEDIADPILRERILGGA